MGWFGQLFAHAREKDSPELLPAIERAVNLVEPLLKQTDTYYQSYRKPVATALEYARSLAASMPGPVTLDRESYASNSYVHALFPSVDFVNEAFCSSHALQNYHRQFPDTEEFYALMGMRRVEKTVTGMELTGGVIQRDVIQKVIYFTSHTLENPAATEAQAREQVAMSFFDSLVKKVKKRVEDRKQDQQALLQEKDLLIARLRAADAQTRHALGNELSGLIAGMQHVTASMDLNHYLEDFEEVLLHPERYLKLIQTPILLDNMGIKQESADADPAQTVLFNDLIDFDRRNWTVTMVHCGKMQNESFTDKLEQAYRKLSI